MKEFRKKDVFERFWKFIVGLVWTDAKKPCLESSDGMGSRGLGTIKTAWVLQKLLENECKSRCVDVTS